MSPLRRRLCVDRGRLDRRRRASRQERTKAASQRETAVWQEAGRVYLGAHLAGPQFSSLVKQRGPESAAGRWAARGGTGQLGVAHTPHHPALPATDAAGTRPPTPKSGEYEAVVYVRERQDSIQGGAAAVRRAPQCGVIANQTTPRQNRAPVLAALQMRLSLFNMHMWLS